MKKCFSIIAMLLLAFELVALSVPQFRTAQLATFFFHDHGGKGELRLVENSPFCHMHIYCAVDGKGFVIMSSDDIVSPVLAYSISSPFSLESMGENTRFWLERYDSNIELRIDKAHRQSTKVKEEWEHLSAMIPSPKKVPVANTPYNTANLLSTTWGQEPYYNRKCPAGAVTGCVATAMGQIMRYWEHPLRGMGKHQYKLKHYGIQEADFSDKEFQFHLMPPELNDSSTDDEVNAVALLLRRCGIAVDMQYSSTGSGAWTAGKDTIGYPSAENALREYFKYKHSLHTVCKDNYTDSAWIAILKNEIDNGRPVLYSACSIAGHAFVCCGYDDTGKFYFNWGWKGENDGYFHIDSLIVQGMWFDYDTKAIIGIEPDTAECSSTTIRVTSDNPQEGAAMGSGVYQTYVDSVTIEARANPGYLFDRWDENLDHNPFQFYANGCDVTHTAHFTKMEGDTLCYCIDESFSKQGVTGENDSTMIWGIRFGPNSIAKNKGLTEVMLPINQGTYKLYVFKGGTVAPSRLVYSDTFDISYHYETSIYRWHSIPLDDTIAVESDQSLWIAFEITCTCKPMVYSRYTGNPDGAWIADKIDGHWTNQIRDNHTYISYQIRGIFTDYVASHNENEGEKLYDADVFTNGNNIVVASAEGLDIKIYDTLGRLLAARKASEDREYFHVTSGIYFVIIEDQTHKVMVR